MLRIRYSPILCSLGQLLSSRIIDPGCKNLLFTHKIDEKITSEDDLLRLSSLYDHIFLVPSTYPDLLEEEDRYVDYSFSFKNISYLNNKRKVIGKYSFLGSVLDHRDPRFAEDLDFIANEIHCERNVKKKEEERVYLLGNRLNGSFKYLMSPSSRLVAPFQFKGFSIEYIHKDKNFMDLITTKNEKNELRVPMFSGFLGSIEKRIEVEQQ